MGYSAVNVLDVAPLQSFQRETTRTFTRTMTMKTSRKTDNWCSQGKPGEVRWLFRTWLGCGMNPSGSELRNKRKQVCWVEKTAASVRDIPSSLCLWWKQVKWKHPVIYESKAQEKTWEVILDLGTHTTTQDLNRYENVQGLSRKKIDRDREVEAEARKSWCQVNKWQLDKVVPSTLERSSNLKGERYSLSLATKRALVFFARVVFSGRSGTETRVQ